MQRYADGDAGAFEPLFGRYKDRIYRYVKRLCQNETDNNGTVEELCQDVWERLIQHRDRFDASRSFATYMFSIAHNRIVDHFRSTSSRSYEEFREDSGPADCAVVENQVYGRQQVRRFLQVFESLPAPQREIFLLHEETSMTLAEMADATGVKLETARSRFRFALLNLRKGMANCQ